jgi:hypothetical protein
MVAKALFKMDAASEMKEQLDNILMNGWLFTRKDGLSLCLHKSLGEQQSWHHGETTPVSLWTVLLSF